MLLKKLKKKFFGKKLPNLPIINQRLNPKLIDKNAINIIKTLNKEGFDAYLVGGCIRDILLGLKPKDFDIVTSATPTQIHTIFKRSRIIGRRFQIVHIVFNRREFIEVATFRGNETNTTMVKNDNNFGDITTDALRRDLTINALYYNPIKEQIIDLTQANDDIINKKIKVIGDGNLRFSQDPVRILRAIRFGVKLNFKIDNEVKMSIKNNKHLLKNIPPARFFEETLKLFHNSQSYQTFLSLQQFGVLKFLFPQTQDSLLVEVALKNTANRIKKNLGVSPAFIFVIFLYDDYLNILTLNKKTIKSISIAREQAASTAIANQTKFIAIPKFIVNKIKNTWILQHKLEKKQQNSIKKILMVQDFRMAYDFLVIRSKSINLELKEVTNFWTKAQKI